MRTGAALQRLNAHGSYVTALYKTVVKKHTHTHKADVHRVQTRCDEKYERTTLLESSKKEARPSQ